MKKALLYILLLIAAPGYAQVSFQFLPEIYGRSVDGLFNARIINPNGSRTATLTIAVSESKNGGVVLIRTAAFTIAPGINLVPPAAVRNASVQFSNSPIGVVSRNNTYFPEGAYDYCFTLNFNDIQADAAAEQCFAYELTPFAELNLIDPYDNDKICDIRPTLTWQPLIPGIAGGFYQLVLAEIKSGQRPVEALNYNLPLINQSNITATVLPYPSIVPALIKGKKYAWQVTAYKNQTVLNRSEVWEFKVECPDTVKKIIQVNSYRDLEDIIKGNYYIANGIVHFAFVNPYDSQKLKYEIRALDDNNKKVKGLPTIHLERGNNKIDIDLAGLSSMVDGNFYILKIFMPNGSTKDLRFIYYESK